QSTKDALLLFEAVRQNRLPKITRRLREEERAELIRSGAVFVFDEAESGVKRWTDGLYWSPSRILNNFL
ncbi:Global transcription regulator sge1, partial [Tilletia horrida]